MPEGVLPARESLGRFHRVTVMGLGRFGGGGGAARYFAGLGARVTVTDLDGPEKLAASIASLAEFDIRFVLGRHEREDFVQTDLVIANQAVRPENEFLQAARGAGVPVASETGLALSLNRSPWIGVTGSAGKSTTSALIAAMLSAHDPRTLFGGNIGGDLLTRVENRPEDAPLVTELSSYQLSHLAADFAAGRIAPPRAAALTNLLPNHLDWHRDMEEYVESKLSLVRRLPPDGWAVLNVDDPRIWNFAEKLAAGGPDPAASPPPGIIRCAWRDAGGDNACFVDGGELVLRLGQRRVFAFALAKLPLPGRHNAMNAVLATAAAYAVCRNADAASSGLAAFRGLPHRLEKVGTAKGITFVNDSKATTPESAIFALAAINGPKILLAGGYDKHSPFEALGAAIQQRADGLVLMGGAAARLRQAVLAAAAARPATAGSLKMAAAGGDFDAAVLEAFRLAPAGGTVLLSPACASWGMFANYEERGQRFREIVERLGQTC
ncbi:MAG: UDP-N-acetylmuramoyl-L-alanine--D-glutamate ligase [Planctomycetota bacterium]|jgi:UDP-N-acetylmuramoylalanine--D-glutamate ligase|nr:UDP-N-acetylmuramoyl-L-alanine--D-glutamate ligase [Planctomycetota bacterium]